MTTITKSRFQQKLAGKMSPPPKAGAGTNKEQASPCSGDRVDFSEAACSKPSSKGLWATIALAGAAAISLASIANPGGAEVAAPVEMEHPGSPFEMVRDADGKVVFHLGIGDEVVEPLAPTHKEAPHLTDHAYTKRGQTVCEQAKPLGGTCDFEHAASIPTPYGDMIVEQNSDYSLDIYSNNGGHVRMEVEAGGVDVSTQNGSAYFLNDGSIVYR